jgi:serine/threonine-protein kinase
MLAPGTRLGKYEVRRRLGSGGMGAVYEATHLEIGKRVAIKVLSPAIAAIPGAQSRFLREAQLTSKVRHPHIVDVTDMGNEAGRAYIVMEFLDGEDLAQHLERTGALSPQEIADIMLPVCSAVAEAHRAGITHRDLKPQNIFLATRPYGVEPKVLDFGISKGPDTQAAALTGTGIIGTPFYFAPEQILDPRSAGPASDQYALGVILYECLTARRPYESENLFLVFQEIVEGKARPPRELRPDLPTDLEDLILRAMHRDPKARFASADDLGQALLWFASPRQQSIWEQAFAARAQGAPATSPRRPAAASPSQGGATPPPRSASGATPPPRPATTPMGSFGRAHGVPPAAVTPAAVTPAAPGPVPPASLYRDFVADEPGFESPRPPWKKIAIAAVLVGGGLAAAWLAWPGTRDAATKPSGQTASAVSVPAKPAASPPSPEPPPAPPPQAAAPKPSEPVRPPTGPVVAAPPPAPEAKRPHVEKASRARHASSSHASAAKPKAPGHGPTLNPNAAPLID